MNSPVMRPNITWLLLVSDIIGLTVCFNLAFVLRLNEFLDLRSPLWYILVVVYLLGLYLTDTYKLTKQGSSFWLREQIVLGILATVTAITSLIYLSGLWGSNPLVGRGILFISVTFFTIWAIACRTLASQWLKQQQQDSRFLILGSSEKALSFRDKYQSEQKNAQFVFLAENKRDVRLLNQYRREENYSDANSNIATEIKSSGNRDRETTLRDRGLIIDSLDNFDSWCQQSWSGVLIDNVNNKLDEAIVRELMKMRLRGIYVYNLVDFCEQFWHKIPPAYIQDDWFAFSSGFSILHNPVDAKLKQILDFAIASILLLAILPLTLLTAIAIKLDSPGPIFYSQVRTGLNNEKFYVYKFRSMRQDAEKMGVQWAQEKDPRITRVGRILRMTRIDELPQIWNVLKGEMSLIGPRPERPEFDLDLRQAIPYYDLRYLVKPGITGWAQVCYPYGASVEDAYQKVAYDLYYIKNYSLGLDAAIALKTLRVVILGKGR